MTDKLYTLSDLEALRERCAKEIEDCHEGGHCGEGTFDIIKRQRFNSVLKQAAAIIRSVPLTTQTEEVFRCPNTNRGLHHCGASAHPKHGGGHFYSCTLIDCPLMARATTQTEEGKK